MAVPTSKGGPKIIEEIVLKIALPTITMIKSPRGSTSIGRSVPQSGMQGGQYPQTGPSSQGIQPKIITEEMLNEPSPGEPFPADTSAAGERQQAAQQGARVKTEYIDGGRGLPPPPEFLPQPQITVIRLEDLDLDAPPSPDEQKTRPSEMPQPQVIPQVIVMTDGQMTEDAPKPADETRQTQQFQLPPQLQQIYSIDPNVIKRLQWRLARMEDFETAIGLAVQEIKEAIAKMETTRLELEEMRKGYAAVEKTMHELAALYDLISASVNPFIDSEDEQRTISTKIMKRTLGMSDTGASVPVSTGLLSSTLPETIKKKDEHLEDYSVDTWAVKWAEFLLERIPKAKIPALLDHYIEIGWLDEEVKARIEETIRGISEIDLGISMPESDDGTEEERKKLDWWKLPIDDHVKSLQFIEKIRGGRIGNPAPSEDAKKKKA